MKASTTKGTMTSSPLTSRRDVITIVTDDVTTVTVTTTLRISDWYTISCKCGAFRD